MAAAAEPLLENLVERELRRVQAFLAVLRQEKSLLETANTEPLVALAEEKTRLAVELSQLCQAREAELTRLGLVPGKAGMNVWCESADAASRSRWQRLLEAAGEAKAINDTNGKLIALKLQHNQRALTVLTAATNQATTYGPDGQQRLPSGGRSLGSA